MKRFTACVGIAAVVLGALTTYANAADDLGRIVVESTTIDDRLAGGKHQPSTVTVISGEQVDRAHAESVKQILDAVPGITTELQSQDSLKIHIRGVENQRFMGEKPGVAVVIDGVPVFERTGRVNINLDDVESIKVIKGGASWLFGEDALAGAVIITTKRGAKMAGYKASAEAGSFGYRRGLARAGFAGERFAGHIQASRRQSDSYYFQGDYRADYLNGKLQAYLGDASDLTFGWELARRKKDSHGSVSGVTQAMLDPRSVNGRDFARKFDVNLDKFHLSWSSDLSDTSNLMAMLYQFGDHTKFWSFPIRYDAAGQPVTDINAYANDNDYKQIQRGFKSEWRAGTGRLGWMLGLDARANSYRNRVVVRQSYKSSPSPFSPVVQAGTVSADNKTKERVLAGYGELKFGLTPSLTLTANSRYDNLKLDYSDHLPAAPAPSLNKSFNVASWRGGFGWALAPEMTLYGNVSTGFRAPTIRQLFAGTINPFGNTLANPNLKPERSVNYELGLRGEGDFLGGASWDLAVFRIERKDFILDVAGQYNFAKGETRQYQNIGGMRNQGIELSLKAGRKLPLGLDLAYTLLDARFTRYDHAGLVLGNPFSPRPGAHRVIYFNNTGKRIPRVPMHHLFAALHWRPASHSEITLEMDATSSYYADEFNQLKIGGRSVFNLVANHEMRISDDVTLSLFGRIDNLLDRFYYNTARGFRDANNDFVYNAEDLSLVVNPGFRWTAGLTAEF
ncbi:MAG: TonB-dependent receptor [Mariprofundaceae bacterium]